MRLTRPVMIVSTERVEFRSTVNRRRYSISVALPRVRVPDRGCPAFYVLDGYSYFASAVEAVRANRPDVVVVGIGYPDDEAYIEGVLDRHRPLPASLKGEPAADAAFSLERMYDLSLPASDEVLRADFPPEFRMASKDVGGLDDFLKTIEAEIKPRVGEMIAIDSSDQAIFGHSLGGLAVVHALFVAPNSFRTFIASSPSIWWNGRAVLAGEPKLSEAIKARSANPRVLVTMGSEEETPDPRIAAQYGMDFAEFSPRIRRHRMVQNARELTERLKALAGSGAVGDYAVFPKQHHGFAPWAALGRAIAFAL